MNLNLSSRRCVTIQITASFRTQVSSYTTTVGSNLQQASVEEDMFTVLYTSSAFYKTKNDMRKMLLVSRTSSLRRRRTQLTC